MALTEDQQKELALRIFRACHAGGGEDTHPRVWEYEWGGVITASEPEVVRVKTNYYNYITVEITIGSLEISLSGDIAEVEAALASLPDSLKVQPRPRE